MSPSIRKFLTTRRFRRYALVAAVWIGANVLALAGINLYETHQLSQEYDVAAGVIRQYQFQTIRIPTAAPDQEVSLWYRFRPPGRWTGHHSVPLFVYLHGAGERGIDNVRQLRSVPAVLREPSLLDAFPCAVLAPQCPEGFNWSSRFDAEVDMLDAVLQMIDVVLRDTRIDPRRIYLVGFSMGGFGAWSLAARAPDRFAAVVPIAGGGNPSLAEVYVDVPLWAVHGVEDDVVPASHSQTMVAAIREVGGKPHLTLLEGVSHRSWPEVIREDSEILKWVFRQSAGANGSRSSVHRSPDAG